MRGIFITIACLQCIKICFLWSSSVQYFITPRHCLAYVEWNGFWCDTAMRECANQIHGVCQLAATLIMVCWTTVRGRVWQHTHTHTHTHTYRIFPVVMWIYRSHSEPEQLWRQMFQIKKTLLGRNTLETRSAGLPANKVSRRRFSWPGTDEIPTIPPCNLSPPLGYTTSTNHSRHVGLILLVAECPLRIQQEVSSSAISIFVPLSSLSPRLSFTSHLFRLPFIILDAFECRSQQWVANS